MTVKTSAKIGVKHKNTVLLADIFFVYTILAPIILNVFGSYFKLNENFIRTFIVLLGPAFVSIIIYIKVFGLNLTRKSRYAIFFVFCLTLIIYFSSIKNWDSTYTKEGLKFFIAYCVFGFFFGVTAKVTLQRAKNINIIWILYILIFLLFSLHLFLLQGFSLYRFTLPGDNSARTTALFLFFTFCGLNSFLLFKSVTTKLFLVSLSILCVFIAIISSSRSAIVVFLLVLFFYLLFQSIQSKDSFHKKSLIYFLSVLILFCGLIWFLAMHKIKKERILSATQIPGQIIAYIFNNDQESYKNIVRLPMWNNAITKFKENPLFGAGYGSEYYNEIINKKFIHPHSVFFQFMAETGIIGLGTFILFIIFVFKKAINDYRSLNAKNDKLSYLFYPLSFTFFLLFSCFHFAVHENYFFWYFGGIITGFDTTG